MIIFLDGNPGNLSKDNLLDVSPQELRMLYKEHKKMKIRNYAEITKISLLNIKLELLIEEKRKLKETAIKNGTLNSKKSK